MTKEIFLSLVWCPVVTEVFGRILRNEVYTLTPGVCCATVRRGRVHISLHAWLYVFLLSIGHGIPSCCAHDTSEASHLIGPLSSWFFSSSVSI